MGGGLVVGGAVAVEGGLVADVPEDPLGALEDGAGVLVEGAPGDPCGAVVEEGGEPEPGCDTVGDDGEVAGGCVEPDPAVVAPAVPREEVFGFV